MYEIGLLQVAGAALVLLFFVLLNILLSSSMNTELIVENTDDYAITIPKVFFEVSNNYQQSVMKWQDQYSRGVCLFAGHRYKSSADDPSVFSSTVFPSNSKQQPSVGNGYLATVIYSNTVYVNGLYNGKGTSSHRARVPSTAAITASLQESPVSASHFYILDVAKGVFVHQITTGDVKVSHTTYAHQVLNRLLVNQIIISRTSNKSDEVTVKLDTNSLPNSTDINFKENPLKDNIRSMQGGIIVPEHDSTQVVTAYVYWTDVPSCITLPKDVSARQYNFITSISKTSGDEAYYFYTEGLKMTANNELYQNHVAAWETKWRNGHIDIDNVYLSRIIYSTMYYILSSLPPLNTTGRLDFPFYGLAPGGLANGGGNQDYMGHVFWDQETWMYPPILLFHPNLAKSMLSSRTRHIDAARNIAKCNGYNGTMYPWEMAYSGYDVCPDRTVGKFEQHVNGDIAYALQQYVRMTEDVQFLLEENGFDLAKGLAEFWYSRVYNISMTKYGVMGVMPPDEYHENVNNSVYTNMVAKISLLLPKQLAQMLNTSVPECWSDVGNQMYIPYDSSLKYHPEYDGYQLGTVVKQADAILLQFPLMYDMPDDVQVNDLLLYETYKGKPVTNPDGPAMTWAMFTINWLKLKNFTKAYDVFNKTFANIQEPFMTWTENPDGTGAVNFQTGMGGFLQTITFGFGGIRIKSCLEFDFVLPPKSTTFNITGLNYLSSSLNFVARETSLSITLTEDNYRSIIPSLQLIVSKTETYDLKLGKTVKIARVPARICKKQNV
ncbi:protein-glucosylgalactosylhydroxylysine glucosidase-like isoform X2 [Antedon mediterranea]|uniref:protein-glucosylgalactosylhydroxylysine glucosidase-like isoform X2 n=1 Tax=Antedon mediterranea TaxID=105859 RepID=UPI003AF97595